ncbi:hypothetical protein SDC9_59214 [bioreactor metagenome]|uniref:Uncharacterized protein n=1 Tax=bioreactor metagenome TaxID=1076179 RepID=A0A644X9L4_9ZZZZ
MALDDEEIRVLKSAQCPSLSERSILSYDIGSDPERHVHMRITANTGNGQFNAAWVAYDAIEPLLMKADVLSGSALASLFRGTSVNTAGFILAALKHMGAVDAMLTKRHSYQCRDLDAFRRELQGLMDPLPAPDSDRSSIPNAFTGYRPLKESRSRSKK